MNKSLANKLKQHLITTPFVDKFAGLVQVAEYQETTYDESGTIPTTVIKRIPVSCDVSYSASFQSDNNDNFTSGQYDCDAKDLCPDNRYKGVLYFEDLGTQSIGKEVEYLRYRSRLRLVVWLNTKWLKDASCADSSALLMNYIINRLDGIGNKNIGHFIRLSVSVDNIPKQDKAVFSPYTYDLFNTQYIMLPYEFFAIDLSVEYMMHESCIDSLIIKTREEFEQCN